MDFFIKLNKLCIKINFGYTLNPEYNGTQQKISGLNTERLQRGIKKFFFD